MSRALATSLSEDAAAATVRQLSLQLPSPPQPATMPPEERGLARDGVKLLVLNKATGQTEHARFRELPRFLEAGDVLVVNDSKTLPAQLPAVRQMDGTALRLHLAARLSAHVFIVERRTADGGPDAAAFAVGEALHVAGCRLTVIGRFHPNSRLWYVESEADLWPIAQQIGHPIRYGYVPTAHDLRMYQTVFGKRTGSAEMPSAGRPLTHRVLRALAAKGVHVASLTLHTGVSSHEVSADLTNHPFLPEWYRVPAATARAVNAAHQDGRRVIAVGTTVVRALETVWDETTQRATANSGWTTRIVTPEQPARATTGLLTGFHESDTSHLAMLFSLVRPDWLESAYAEAITQGYLWHEFGDVNLIV